jgi:hypothetical protein
LWRGRGSTDALQELEIGDGDSVFTDNWACSDACHHWKGFHFCGSGRICSHKPFTVAGREVGDGDCEERHFGLTWDNTLNGRRCWVLGFESTVLLIMIDVSKKGTLKAFWTYIYTFRFSGNSTGISDTLKSISDVVARFFLLGV